jgi:hypothetical protein
METISRKIDTPHYYNRVRQVRLVRQVRQVRRVRQIYFITFLFTNRLALLVLTLCLSTFLLVVYMDQRLPVPLTLQDAAGNPDIGERKSAGKPDRFIEERARNSLSVGARPAGNHSVPIFERYLEM